VRIEKICSNTENKILFQTTQKIVPLYCHVMGFVATNNYDSLNELHTPNITETTEHIKSSQSSLTVAW
jgi:hypothetical protein